LNPAEKILVGELTELVKEGRSRMLGVIRQELLSGIKTNEQFEKLRTTLRSLPDERLETADYEFAAKNSNNCRAKGIVVSIVDAMICAVGATHDWPIFTCDPHFRNYAGVLKIKLHNPR
jgi:predicted nucleic acid-binding protein